MDRNHLTLAIFSSFATAILSIRSNSPDRVAWFDGNEALSSHDGCVCRPGSKQSCHSKCPMSAGGAFEKFLPAPKKVRFLGKTGSNQRTVKKTRLTQLGVRQESWQRIGGESPPWGKD